MIGAGVRNKRVSLQTRSDTLDDYGQRVRTWTETAKIMAAIRPLYGRELEAARQTVSEVSHEFLINYREGLDSSCRFVYQGRYYNIQAALDDNMSHDQLKVLCTEGTNDG